MKKCVKFLTGVLTAFTLIASVFPTTPVNAETAKKTYTVTFRAGNVGSFNLEAGNIRGENIEATENYIKFTVEKGESLSSTFDFISDDASLDAYFLNVTSASEDAEYIDAGYRLKAVSEWAADAAQKEVKRNTQYVLDYAKLVNPVKYTIRFVDASSEEQIAPSTIAYGNAEEEILCTPLHISNYSTEDQAITMTLKEEDESANVVTFKYTYTGEVETITNTVTNVIPGETITETVVNEVTVVEPGGAAVVNPQQDAQNPAQDQVEIPDEQVPLADGQDENADQDNAEDPAENPTEDNQNVTIEDEETPLAAGEQETKPSYWAPILGGAALAVVLSAAIVAVVMFKKKISQNHK